MFVDVTKEEVVSEACNALF